MPLARFEVEQLEGNRWVAEVEAGGFAGMPNFRHVRLNATSFEAMMAAVNEFYCTQTTPKPLAEPEPTPLQEAMSQQDAESEEDPGPRDPHDNERILLRREADALGVDIDLRWGAKRLKAEIAKAADGETVVE